MTTPEPEGARSGTSARSVVSWVETVIAPLGAVTALLLFFGWPRSRAYFGYFGIDQGVLQYAPQEHILRSADSMFGTVVRLMALVLALVVVERVVARFGAVARPGPAARWLRVAVVSVGLVLLAVGLLLALGGDVPWVDVPPIVGALALVAGAVIMLRIGLGWLPAAAVAPGPARVLAVVALSVAAFWAATLYAQAAGEQLARETDESPAGLPLVTVYSEEFLDLPGALVTPSAVQGADGGVRYRYTGLRLLTYSNERWFLLTGRYREGYRSTALVLRDGEKLRVEVANQR